MPSRQPNFRPINRGPLLLETVPEAIYDSVHMSPMYRSSHERVGVDPNIWRDGRDEQHFQHNINNENQMLRGLTEIQ